MAASQVTVKGYRSLRDVRVDLGALNLIVGPNGSGKTNLYRSLYLLARAAAGQLARAMADEGGMPSALWAGQRKKGAVRMSIAAFVDPLRYELRLGLPIVGGKFPLDPLVKEERVTIHADGHESILVARDGPAATLRDSEGNRVTVGPNLRDGESVLAQLVDGHRFPTAAHIREELLRWRFYHGFRTDASAPLRRPQIGVQTPVLSDDGDDLAAALLTIVDIGDERLLHELVGRAFPGSRVHIEGNDRAQLNVLLEVPGLHRPLSAAELSDGTLRYLCLLAALLSPRPPPLIALNEPETSLHPDLLPALAELLVAAAARGQVVVTTHSEPLVALVKASGRPDVIRLEKVDGETRVVD